MRKVLLALAAIMGMLSVQLTLIGNSVYATNTGNSGNSSGTIKCEEDHFLGLRAWYDGVRAVCNGEQPKDEDDVRKMVWQIILNLATMLLQLSGYICVGFVIWGGYLYMLSRGDPSKAAGGKRTMTNALIGIVLCVTASLISGAMVDIAEVARGKTKPGEFFQEIFNHAFLWAGIVCVIIIIMGGIGYVTSVGNAQKTEKAKGTLINAAVGLIITLVATAIVNLIVMAVNG